MARRLRPGLALVALAVGAAGDALRRERVLASPDVPAGDAGREEEEIHFAVIIKGLDSDMIGASQQVFLEAPLAHSIAESTGVPPQSVHDMDGNPGTVSMGPGTEEVERIWWPRASPACRTNNAPGDDPHAPYTIVSGMVPVPRDEAREFSEKMDSEALRQGLLALLEEKFPKGALAVSGHMQLCAANDGHEEPPTSSTMTTRTATTRTTVTTLRPVAPPALAGAVPVDIPADALPVLPGPTFTTTATTTMDTFAFSADQCHWCLHGNGPRGPMVDTTNCHTFLQQGRSFVSTMYQDQCLDLYHNMFGSWGLWSCSGSDQQLFSNLDEDKWCASKEGTTMCLTRCRHGADGALSTTTTGAPYNILRDGVPTFVNAVTSEEWWAGHVRRNAPVLVVMLIVFVLGACLVSRCCLSHKEDEERRRKHQYHNDSYFDSEDRYDDDRHRHSGSHSGSEDRYDDDRHRHRSGSHSGSEGGRDRPHLIDSLFGFEGGRDDHRHHHHNGSHSGSEDRHSRRHHHNGSHSGSEDRYDRRHHHHHHNGSHSGSEDRHDRRHHHHHNGSNSGSEDGYDRRHHHHHHHHGGADIRMGDSD